MVGIWSNFGWMVPRSMEHNPTDFEQEIHSGSYDWVPQVADPSFKFCQKLRKHTTFQMFMVSRVSWRGPFVLEPN